MKKLFTLLLLIQLAFVSAAQKKSIFVKFGPKSNRLSEDATGSQLRGYVGMKENEGLKLVKTEKDKFGFTHHRFSQTYKGVRVEHGIIISHSRKGKIESINGEYYPTYDIASNPVLSSGEAFERAKLYVGGQVEDQSLKNDLVIYQNVLAWKHDILVKKPFGAYRIYINAITGEEVSRTSLILESNAVGSAQTRYSGTQAINTELNAATNQYRLKDNIRNIHTYDLNSQEDYALAQDTWDDDNNWTTAEYQSIDKDINTDAHWGLGVTYDYFLNQHGRNSIDGNGMALNAYTNFSTGFFNAFWYDNKMTFGNIPYGSYVGPMVTLDVVAHELSHGFCQYSANLIYHSESGALNESLSDIWGACVEYYANNQYGLNKNVWTMGDQVYPSGQIRSLINPNDNSQPDTYKGTYWYSGSNDNGGVHTNSGPFNHWFYLLASPGNKQGVNDFGTSFTVNSVGMDRAAAIVFRAETSYLTPTSEYADMRNATIQAAEDIFGTGSQTVLEVKAAWKAIGVPHTICEVSATDVATAWIGSVEVAGVFNQNDNTVSATGYTDYSQNQTFTFNAVKTQAYTINLTPTFGNLNPNTDINWGVWIDKDGNDIFDPITEVVFSGTHQGPVTFQYVASGKIGVAKMRVRMEVGAGLTASPCNIVQSGEIEDYKIIFSPLACEPPSNLNASLGTTDDFDHYNVTFSWSDPYEIDNYEIFYTDVVGAGWINKSMTSTSGSINLNLQPYDSWNVKIRSNCGNQFSAWSNFLQVIVPPVPPNPNAPCSTPTNAQVTLGPPDNNGNRIATFSWADSSNAGIYLIRYKNDYYPFWDELTSYDTTYTTPWTFSPGNLLFQIRAKCPAGISNWTDTTYWSVPCPWPAPGNVQSANLTETTAEISWDAVPNQYHYMVRYRYLGGVNWLQKEIYNALQADLIGLNAGTTYEYQVATMCNNLPGDWSSLNTFTTICPIPTNISALLNAPDNSGARTVTISWNDNYLVGNYDVRYKTINYAIWETGTTSNTNFTTWDLVAGTNWMYQVRAACSSNSSDWSSVFNFSLPCLILPSNIHTGTITETTSQIIWDPVLNQQTYKIRYRKSGDVNWMQTSIADSQINLLQLLSGTTYEFQMATACQYSDSDWSTSNYFTTMCVSKGLASASDWIDLVQLNGMSNVSGNDGGYKFYNNVVPPELRQTYSYSLGFSAAWPLTAGKVRTENWGAYIDFNRDGDFIDAGEQIMTSSTSTSGTTNANFSIPASAILGYTRMRVSMKHEGALIGPCEIFSNGEVEDYLVNVADANGGTGMRTRAPELSSSDEAETKKTITMHPNPTKGTLFISNAENKSQIRILVTDIMGKEVMNLPFTEEVNVQALSPGIYLLKIKTGKNSKQFRFVKE